MWTKPWGFKEGIAAGCGLVATGLLLQAAFGRVGWEAFRAPVNAAVLAGYVLLLISMHLFRRRVYLFRWLSSPAAAVAALAWCVALTVVMGLVRQLPAYRPGFGFPGFRQMLSQWSFVLVYLWLSTSLGLTVLRAGFPLRRSKIPFWLNHAGLFIVLTAATLGNADMRRLRMTVHSGQAEWRAADDHGTLHEMPLAVELRDFTIDEYPPKLLLVDTTTGEALPARRPEHLLLEPDVVRGTLCGWDIVVEAWLPAAAPVVMADTVRFTEFHSRGAAAAVLVRARDAVTGAERRGWVSCGSFLFPYRTLRLDDTESLVMSDPEPRRFASAVRVYTQSGLALADTIEVNRPMKIDGWKIYQSGYDETKGRWSDISVFELVRDPWLPYVYMGIWMLIAGAVCLIVRSRKREEDLR